MIKIAVLTFFAAPLVVFAAPDLSSYEMVFNDEFNGSSLDQSKWATSPIWGPFLVTNAEQQYYVDRHGLDANHPVNPFVLDGQSLTIRAVPVGDLPTPAQPAEGDSIWSQYPEYTRNPDYSPNDATHYSGLISSVNSFTFTHGYAEARVQVPAGQGLWPAFWLLTNKYVEDAPEIDIMESIGQYPNEVNHTMHYFDTSNNWALVSTPTYKTTGPDYTANFHTYGMLWSPDSVAWYVDGVEVKRVDSTEFKISSQAMYVIANLAVGGNWPGPPDETTPDPADVKLDYIRVYQRKAPAAITPATLASDYQLMFADEFNGNALDSSKWNTSFLWGPHHRINNEEQVYVDVLDTHTNFANNPFTVSNGTLKITADEVEPANIPQQPASGSAYWSSHPERQHNGDYGNSWIPGYTSGIITSYDSFKFIHGYVEYRAKLPKGDGVWPALWLLNGYYVGPMPEIDIMELQGEVPDIVHQSYHYFDNTGNLQSSATTHALPTGDFSDDFHTFGVKWHPGEIIWYVDGVPVRTLQGPEVSLQLMYLLANVAVGGNFVGPVGDEFPATMEIDYVRAYQLREFPVTSPPPPQLPGEITPLSPLVSTETATPSYEWEDLGNVDQYRIVIYDKTLGGVIHIDGYDSDEICTNGVCTLIPEGVQLSYGDNHFWRLRAYNEAGWNSWSGLYTFDYEEALTVPGTITPLSPLGSTNTATPSYQWEDLGNVDQYRIVIYDKTIGGVIHIDGYDSDEICANGVCSLVPEGVQLSYGENHFWRLRAYNAAGWNAWSSLHTFDYEELTVPGMITPLSPLGSTETATPSYEWEDLGNVDQYRIVIYDKTIGGVIHIDGYDSGEICANDVCTLTPEGIQLSYGENHFWRLRAYNAAGWNAWSDLHKFDYTMTLPAPVVPISPITTSTVVNPTYQWEAQAGVETYYLQIDDVGGAESFVAWGVQYEADNICNAGVCSVVPTSPTLDPNGSYSWRVRAMNDSGWNLFNSPVNLVYAP